MSASRAYSVDGIYRAAFAAAGLPADGDALALAAAVAAKRPGLPEALVRALDDWYSRLRFPPDPDARRVRAAADLADPDSTRKEIRAAASAGVKATLARLVESLKPAELDPATGVALGVARRQEGLAPDALRIFRAARERHPSDFYLITQLAGALHMVSPDDPVAVEEAIGCAGAAVAAYPEKAWPHYLVEFLYGTDKRELDFVEPHFLRALELNNRFTFAMSLLGDIRKQKGDLAGAERWY
jgi:hypothetical protein